MGYFTTVYDVPRTCERCGMLGLVEVQLKTDNDYCLPRVRWGELLDMGADHYSVRPGLYSGAGDRWCEGCQGPDPVLSPFYQCPIYGFVVKVEASGRTACVFDIELANRLNEAGGWVALLPDGEPQWPI